MKQISHTLFNYLKLSRDEAMKKIPRRHKMGVTLLHIKGKDRKAFAIWVGIFTKGCIWTVII